MSGPTVRPAEAGESPAIAAVFLAARRGLLPDIPMVHPDADAPRWIRDILFATTAIWVAVEDGGIVAMMSLSPGWLEHLYVHPQAQGRGIGAALLETAKRSDHGAAGLRLWTFQANAKARRFYERHGFAAEAFTDGSGNEERTPDVRYVWLAHSR